MQDHERYKLAFMIADRFGDLLTKGEIPTEIIGHTTTREAIPNVTGRDRPIVYVRLKSPEEPHNLLTVQRLCAILHTEMQSLSYDGEALLWCHDRLKKGRAKRRLMFVITDGSASGTYIGNKGNHIRHLTTRHFHDVIVCLEAEKKAEIIGVSLNADVSGFFRRSVRMDSIEDIYRKLSPFTLDLLHELNERKKPAANTHPRPEMVAHRSARLKFSDKGTIIGHQKE
jgi:cobalamin biosynthesis protein CobT